jgi:hypothetical protein
MADKKLSELTETTTGSDTMQLFVNDGGVSKRITRGNLISGAVSAATTTYSIKAGTQIGGAGLELDAGGAGSGTDTVKIMESGSATVTRTDADTITIGATNTTYVDATTSVAGLMSTADKTKIDAVESAATADQTNAEIKTAYEANADTNEFSDAEQTKLSGIETSATADQTGAEIKTAYEAEANAFTDTKNTKLSGIATSANNYTHPNHSGDVVSAADGATTIQAGAVDIAMLSATGTASGTTFLRGDNTWVVPTDTNTDTKWDGGTTGLTAATGRTSLGLVIGTDVQAYDADTTKNDVANTFSADQTFTALTETKTAKTSSFTPNLSTEGTLYSCTGTMTITMPSAEAGKSFTIIHATATSITWSGTIKWSGGSAPTAGSGFDIYTFVSDGTSWYAMQAGTGFA